MSEQHPHPYGCKCRQCADMAAAINAVGEDGKPFFSDAELLAISESRNEPAETPSTASVPSSEEGT